MILYSPTRLHLVREDIFTTCFLHWILTCYSMQLKNAGACIWLSSQQFTLKYIMNTYDGELHLEPNLIHIFSKDFPPWYVLDISYFAPWGMFLLFIFVQHVTTPENSCPYLVWWTSYNLQLVAQGISFTKDLSIQNNYPIVAWNMLI